MKKTLICFRACLLAASVLSTLDTFMARAQTAPVITQDLANQTVPAGSNVTLSVGVSGTGPFTYQWQLNGTNLSNGIITTIAGGGSQYPGDGGAATNALFSNPNGLAISPNGNVFIADTSHNRVREVQPNGIISTVAGGGSGSDGGPATNASLYQPYGVAVDASGNLFIADTLDQRIREVGTNGIITTVAGKGTSAFYGDGGPATNAYVFSPCGLAVDAYENLLIADTDNNRVREVSHGIIVTVAGNGSGSGGPATELALDQVCGVAVDAFGNLFLTDTFHNRVWVVDADDGISSWVGSGSPSFSGDGENGAVAGLNNPCGVAVDAYGNLLIADTQNSRIREVGTNGIIKTVAGGGGQYPGNGGAATNASLSIPFGVAVDPYGNLFIADTGHNLVRMVVLQGPSILLNLLNPNVAGNYDVVVTSPYGSVTSSVATVTVSYQVEITAQPQNQEAVPGGNAAFGVSAVGGLPPFFYQWYFGGAAVAGQTNSTLLLTNITSNNAGSYQVVVSNLETAATSSVATLTMESIVVQPLNPAVLAGSSVTLAAAVSGSGPFSYQWQFNGTNLPFTNMITTIAGGGIQYPGNNAATNAELSAPFGVAVDVFGNQYIADTGNNLIRKVASNGTIATVAGGGSKGDGFPATNAVLGEPKGVAIDGSGNLFIADTLHTSIRKVGTNGIITTVAGNGTLGYSGDNGAATGAELYSPFGVAVDANGNLFIADTMNYRIRKVGTNGIITTVAGNGTNGFSGDEGAATNAELSSPDGVVVDSYGNLFIADTGNARIREIGSNGIITTVAGGGLQNDGDGGAATNANLHQPDGLTVDPYGNLFITDAYLESSRIREVGTNGIIITVAGKGQYGFTGDGGPATNASLDSPSGVALDANGNIYIADTGNARIRKVNSQGPSLLLSNLSASNFGSYDVVVTSPSGIVTSSVDIVTAAIPAGIAVQPQPQVELLGSSATFSVTASGTPPFFYQWYFDGDSISDQTNSSIFISDVDSNKAGNYQVVVMNGYASVTSIVAELSVVAPALQLQSNTVVAGSSATLSIGVFGAGPLTYQWQHNGTNLPGGIITTVAGGGTNNEAGDGGPATNEKLYGPEGVALDAYGNLFIADTSDQRIAEVTPNGDIFTVAGTGSDSYSGDGGSATKATFNYPSAVAVDEFDNLFVADSGNARVREVTFGSIVTMSGGGAGSYLSNGITATNVRLGNPSGVALDANGNLFIADSIYNVILKVSGNDIISRVAGGGTNNARMGGAATNVSIGTPYGVAVDAYGDLFIPELQDGRVWEVGNNGIITTVAGGAFQNPTNGAQATNVELDDPYSVALDTYGDLFITDRGACKIYEVGVNGIITTVAGNGGRGYSGDGGPATNAMLLFPYAAAVDAYGNLYIADSENNRIRKVVFPGPSLLLTNVGTNNSGVYDVVVSGPYGSVTSSVVTLTVLLPPQNLSANLLTGLGVRLQFTGTPGTAYVLQAATNLSAPIDWQAVVTNLTDTNGNWSFIDTNSLTNTANFYRALLPP